MDNIDLEHSYFIDLSWYENEGRSFLTLASRRLCPSCQRKEISAPKLFQTIKQCCSKKKGFIPPNPPLLEMVFRLFLADSNQLQDLEQIQQQLLKWLADASLRDLSLPKLKRIIENDRYYGLRTVPQETEASDSPESV